MAKKQVVNKEKHVKVDKRLSTIKKVIKDDIFINNVSVEITKLYVSYNRRAKPKPGFKYKRNWFDRISESGNLNKNYFLMNIEDIWLKKSKLNSETREIIRSVCDLALAKTWEYYTKLDEIYGKNEK